MIEREIIAAAERDLARQCRQMHQLIKQFGPCTLGARRRDPFHVMASSIIGQQLSTKAGDTIQRRVHEAAGVRTRLTPEKLLALSHEQLRACGLSNAKCKWLLALSDEVDSGRLKFKDLKRLDDEAAIKVLDALPGVGRWTAEMFLIFALDRLDIFSMGDVGLRNGINALFNDGNKLAEPGTLEIAETWAPYRSVASWYLWRLTDGNSQTWS